MRTLILADLHLDFWFEDSRDPFADVLPEMETLDCIILAGDVSNRPQTNWAPAFHHLAKCAPNAIIYAIPGNHDYYSFQFDMEDSLSELAVENGVLLAQKRLIDLKSIRFLCATLWTDMELGAGFEENSRRVADKMNDYNFIRVAGRGYRRLQPSDTIMRHRDHLAWLEETLATPFEGKTVVVTHHAPHTDVFSPNHAKGFEAVYASDLGDQIRRFEPDLWCYGHYHQGLDVSAGETQIKNVSLGYPEEVSDAAARIRRAIFEF